MFLKTLDNVNFRILFRSFSLVNYLQCSVGIVTNHDLELDPSVVRDLESKICTHKKHRGIVGTPVVAVPQRLDKAVQLLLERYPVPDVLSKAAEHQQYLWGRQLPVEKEHLVHYQQKVQDQVLLQENIDFDDLLPEERDQLQLKLNRKVADTIKKNVYHWKSVKYNAYYSILYLVGCLTRDYSTLYRVFSEIAKRDPKFHPKTLFDFGSGVGSVTWAANEVWPGSIKEHYCVDSSGDINTVARLLMQDAEDDGEMCFPGVTFRQFLPVTTKNPSDVVTSAFTLLELPKQDDRLQTLISLWRKTHKYLVLVENGTNAGFNALIEARDFLLQISAQYSQHPPITPRTAQYSQHPPITPSDPPMRTAQEPALNGHVFAPCPHSLQCPRYVLNDGTPCNFSVSAKPLSIEKVKVDKATFRFSYLVMKKGDKDPDQVDWPRVVRPSSVAASLIHCRTCSSNGQLEYSVITNARHGRDLLRCAKACSWGDLLPVQQKQLLTEESTNTRKRQRKNMQNEEG